MADYITTYTGIHFIPTAPSIEAICIKDIAHALSMICRGNGHVKTFFSVGQHCIHCMKEARERGYSERIQFACLLHDASEAYLSDVPRPFKKNLRGYVELEEKILTLIYEKYLGIPLTKEEQEKVKEIDDDMLYFDLWELLEEKSAREKPEMKSKFSYEMRSFCEVEEEYLKLFDEIFE
jgi:5'-deoxynucleotidase YfbR-like HD superfamily hydrolase